MRRSALVIPLVLFAASAAYANGAMGLALEMFEYRTWAVYVVITVLLEAFIIGRAARLGATKSIVISVCANLFTAFVPATCLTPVFHVAVVGPQVNPNPFWNAVALLASFGIVSALVEMIIWTANASAVTHWKVRGASLLAHVIGIPIALVILLLPERPYQGLERFTLTRRSGVMRNSRDFQYAVWAEESIPKVKTVSELLEHYQKESHRWSNQPDMWAVGYVPEYHRFDTTEMRRRPMELNPAVIGKSFDSKAEGPDWKWLIRFRREPKDRYEGILIEMRTGEIKRSYGGPELYVTTATSPPVH